MSVRGVTVKMSRVVACNAARTCKRCRPLGALTNSRSQHHTSPKKRGKDQMGRLHKADDPLTGFGFCQAWCELLGLEGFWRCDIRFGGNLTNLAWLHPQGL